MASCNGLFHLKLLNLFWHKKDNSQLLISGFNVKNTCSELYNKKLRFSLVFLCSTALIWRIHAVLVLYYLSESNVDSLKHSETVNPFRGQLVVYQLVSIQTKDFHPGVGERPHLSAETGHVELCEKQTTFFRWIFIFWNLLFPTATVSDLSQYCLYYTKQQFHTEVFFLQEVKQLSHIMKFVYPKQLAAVWSSAHRVCIYH